MLVLGANMKLTLTIVISAVTCLCSAANPKCSPLIHKEQLHDIVNQHDLPGLGLCIVQDGKIKQIETVGVRKANTDNSIEREDLFHIGSCTKFMTTCLVQIAVEENKLSWDATLSDLGQSLNCDVDPNMKNISLSELITCTSGLPDDREDPNALPDVTVSELYSFNEDPRAGRRLLTKHRLKKATGVIRDGQYRYSNLAFCLAGVFVEEAYNQPFEKLMKDKFFNPLKMYSAGFGAPVWVNEENQPWGHVGGKPVPSDHRADNPMVIGPAGTVRMSLEDMGRYFLFMLGYRHLSPEIDLQKLLQPSLHSPFARGWGWKDSKNGMGKLLVISGSNCNFDTLFVIATERDLAIAVSANSGDDEAVKACGEVVKTVFKAFNNICEQKDTKVESNS